MAKKPHELTIDELTTLGAEAAKAASIEAWRRGIVTTGRNADYVGQSPNRETVKAAKKLVS